MLGVRDYNVCGECKWLAQERDIKFECMQPNKRERWDKLEQTRTNLGAEDKRVGARYKFKSDKACKYFKPIDKE